MTQLPDPIADPERALAVAYAPPAARAALSALFQLDERFGQIVSTTSEPMIGLMRLAWWREALEKIDHDAAPAEPLLKMLVADALPRGVTGAALAELEDGWAALLDGEPDQSAIDRHARARGGTLFSAAATILGAGDDRLRTVGAIWALTDLAFRHSLASVRDAARRDAVALADALPRRSWPAAARPLAALAVLAMRDARAGHRRQGSPGRLLRALALRVTGR